MHVPGPDEGDIERQEENEGGDGGEGRAKPVLADSVRGSASHRGA